MQRNRILVIEGSPNWCCYYTAKGHRLRVSLGTDDRKTAEIRSKVVLALLSGTALPPHLASLSPHVAMMFFYSLHGGMSADEISRLTWDDILLLPTESLRRSEGQAMYTEEVEVYSLTTNKVVVRVPWRRYLGVLIQLDHLLGVKARTDRACSTVFALFRSVEPNAKVLEGILPQSKWQDELRALLKHSSRATLRHSTRHMLAMILLSDTLH